MRFLPALLGWEPFPSSVGFCSARAATGALLIIGPACTCRDCHKGFLHRSEVPVAGHRQYLTETVSDVPSQHAAGKAGVPHFGVLHDHAVIDTGCWIRNAGSAATRTDEYAHSRAIPGCMKLEFTELIAPSKCWSCAYRTSNVQASSRSRAQTDRMTNHTTRPSIQLRVCMSRDLGRDDKLCLAVPKLAQPIAAFPIFLTPTEVVSRNDKMQRIL